METTPGAICEWFCGREFLRKALAQIHAHGSELLAVVPHQLAPCNRPRDDGKIQVTEWIVFYKNHPRIDCKLCGGTGMFDPGDGDIIECKHP